MASYNELPLVQLLQLAINQGIDVSRFMERSDVISALNGYPAPRSPFGPLFRPQQSQQQQPVISQRLPVFPKVNLQAPQGLQPSIQQPKSFQAPVIPAPVTLRPIIGSDGTFQGIQAIPQQPQRSLAPMLPPQTVQPQSQQPVQPQPRMVVPRQTHEQYRERRDQSEAMVYPPIRDSPYRYATHRPEFTREQIQRLTVPQIRQLSEILGYTTTTTGAKKTEQVNEFMNAQRGKASYERSRDRTIPLDERFRPGGLWGVGWDDIRRLADERGYDLSSVRDNTLLEEAFMREQEREMGPPPMWDPLQVIEQGRHFIRQRAVPLTFEQDPNRHWTENELMDMQKVDLIREMDRRGYQFRRDTTKWGLARAFIEQQGQRPNQ